MTTRTLHVDLLTRVEGEGALDLHIENGKVAAAQLRIFEPPRLFEALLRGRSYMEAADITSRICGICPVAYQVSAVQAMEQALGIEVAAPIKTLRRLIYCGEWIESHALHVVMLHAPDFLGYSDAIMMAADHADRVSAALALKSVGNEIMRVLGGREIHPVNIRVGGFYKVPHERELVHLVDKLQRARELAIGTLEWVGTFNFPRFEGQYECVGLRHPNEYPIEAGRIVSSAGMDIPVEDYTEHFAELQVAYSTALHSVIKNRGAYLVGPLARYTLNFERLPGYIQTLARAAGLEQTCRNPFKSILVRCVELVFACDEALRLIGEYRAPAVPYVEARPRASIGHGCTEAPRGICYHRYELDTDGKILDARIVPPTSQNQLTIESDLRRIAADNLQRSDEELQVCCERAIRNHDPCISCSAHFLKLLVRRE